MFSELNKAPHRRFNPLIGEWVLVSPHRTQRPWQGRQEDSPDNDRPGYDPDCYLCPGNSRAGGQQNPDYSSTFVFTNDFSALLPETPLIRTEEDPLFKAVSESGICKVICFSPRHDQSVPRLSLAEVASVVNVWKEEFEAFQKDKNISYVQIFENKGEIMGCSNPHPHCQIWASSSVPPIVSQEDLRQRNYFEKAANPMLLDYLEREQEQQIRIVYQNDEFVVLVPFWAIWPFEAMILPSSHVPSIDRFTTAQCGALADAYRQLTRAYDAIFDCEFPYTAGIHQAPTTDANHQHWQLHMHFYPPLLRSATVKKFMVGYEMLAAPQRDITPEAAAETLRHSLDVIS